MYDFEDFISYALKFLALVAAGFVVFFLVYSIITSVSGGDDLFSSHSCSCSCCRAKGGDEQ